MLMFILHTYKEGAIPDDIEVKQSFGQERVVPGTGPVRERLQNAVEGEVLLVSGEPEAFMRWLGGKEVWISSNPMLSDWTLETIKAR
jgi:hypothetical protein